MKLFRIRGIQLSLHVSFILLLGYVAWEGGTVAGTQGVFWSLLYTLSLFTSVTLHELGHAFAARRFGIGVSRILLLPIGGVAELESIPRRPRTEIIIALAGPAVNFLLIGLLLTIVRFPEDWDSAYVPFNFAELGRHLVLVNLIMGGFNLIPVFPMDGGRVFRALLAMRLSYAKATRIAVRVGQCLAVIGAGVMALQFENYLGAALFIFIASAAQREWRAVQRREAEEEAWRRSGHPWLIPGDEPAPKRGSSD